jgi:hypothetical protein
MHIRSRGRFYISAYFVCYPSLLLHILFSVIFLENFPRPLLSVLLFIAFFAINKRGGFIHGRIVFGTWHRCCLRTTIARTEHPGNNDEGHPGPRPNISNRSIWYHYGQLVIGFVLRLGDNGTHFFFANCIRGGGGMSSEHAGKRKL